MGQYSVTIAAIHPFIRSNGFFICKEFLNLSPTKPEYIINTGTFNLPAQLRSTREGKEDVVCPLLVLPGLPDSQEQVWVFNRDGVEPSYKQGKLKGLKPGPTKFKQYPYHHEHFASVLSMEQ